MQQLLQVTHKRVKSCAEPLQQFSYNFGHCSRIHGAIVMTPSKFFQQLLKTKMSV